MHIILTWNCGISVEVAFLCLLCVCLPSLSTKEWTNQQDNAKTKMGYISLPSILNDIVGTTNYYCVILKMVISDDAIKAIQNGVIPFPCKRRKYCFFLKNQKKNFVFSKPQKNRWVVFFNKNGFISTLLLSKRKKHSSSRQCVVT